ncbi:MAG: hypothetical protein HYV27_14720 [Candidatus Hydrogenedentes bacterium]|nr:hypothetical protein [Candidatus Hydrogenedentota bacterium]
MRLFHAPMLTCLVLAGLAQAAGSAWAQEEAGVTIWCELDAPVTPYHRPATLTIVAEAPADTPITLPVLPPKIGGLTITATGNANELLEGNRRHLEQQYQLDPLKAEQILLPALGFTWGDGKSGLLPPMLFTARELTTEELEAAAALLDLQGIAELAPPAPLYRWWLAGLAIVLLAGGLYYLWRRMRAAKPAVAPPKPPWEVAISRLLALEARRLAEEGKFGTFYVDLSAILRYYIEDRFNLHAPEQTTPEFLAIAQASGQFTEEQQAFLRQFLRHCDRVKFAQYTPSTPEMSESFATVRAFVEATARQAQLAASAAQVGEAA